MASFRDEPDQSPYKDSGPDTNGDYKDAINQVRSAGSVFITSELFEKLYLSPQKPMKDGRAKTFGNPTPITLLGFVVSITPLACNLMGWRGASGSGVALNGVYYFMGGLTGILGGVFEWIIGNTFPSVVFCCFGGFWLSYAATLTPAFNVYAPYAPADATSEAQGLQASGFTATLAFWFVFMALLCLMFMVCALRTNVLFVVIFLLLSTALQLLAGAYWKMADDLVGNAEIANTLTVTAGAVLFVTALVGWYLFAALMLASVDFPLSLPVGDLSKIVKGRQDKLEPRAAPDGEC